MPKGADLERTFRSPRIALKLDETSSTPAIADDVQIMRVGKFSHPEYGTFSITKAHLLSMKKNFDAGVRGIDLAIDYAHESDKEAAAWFEDVYLSEDGTELWAKVKWTAKGQKVLADKEYRYLSADFSFDYRSNESDQKFGPTLFGAGLTNRPVIKEMEPVVELSETKGDSMSKKSLEQLVDENKNLAEQNAKLSEDLAAAKKKADDAAAGDNKNDPDGDGDEDKLDDVPMSEMKKKLADMQSQLDVANKKCADYEAQMASAKADKVLAEKKTKFDKMLSEGKAVEAQRAPFMSGDSEKFMELAQPVKFKDIGADGNPPPADGEKSPEEQVRELAKAKLSEKKAKDIGDAISKVLSENAELRKQYELRN